tara:strand:- start:63 stop:176 length:114 start_codon:yes stop_codon:yes gene_type:complete
MGKKDIKVKNKILKMNNDKKNNLGINWLYYLTGKIKK